MGEGVRRLAQYFNRCREKRNRLMYWEAGVVNKRDVQRLLQKVAEFQDAVEAWVARHHPRFSPPP